MSYVIVGQLEPLHYLPSGLAKFEDNLDGNLELVYGNPGAKIYRITAPDTSSVISLGTRN